MQSRDIAVGVRQHRRAAKTGRQVIDRAARADPMPVAVVSVRRIRNLCGTLIIRVALISLAASSVIVLVIPFGSAIPVNRLTAP
jgi:hypothetical protein